MEDKRKIREIYDCTSIVSNEELYPLQKWYNKLIEKTIEEIDVADVLRMIRQKQFLNLAISKAIFFLQKDVFIGELYEGEMFEKVSALENSFLKLYENDLICIIKNALIKSEKHDWSYDGEKEEFKGIVEDLARKLM